MPNVAKKITITNILLDALKSDADMKIVLYPNADEQHITRLVGPAARVFESELGDDFLGRTNAVLVKFTPDDVEHIKALQHSLQTRHLMSANTSAALNHAGTADFNAYSATDTPLVHESAQVYSDYLVQRATDPGKQYSRITSDRIAIDWLTKTYPENELMGYDELISSAYSVYVVSLDDLVNEVELNAGHRGTANGEYSWGDEHPDHPVSDWQYEVANNSTRIGYSDWVQHQLESEPDYFKGMS